MKSDHYLDKSGDLASDLGCAMILLFIAAATLVLVGLTGWTVYTVLMLAWRPLLCLAVAWLLIGSVAATSLLIGNGGPWWQPYARLRNELHARGCRIRKEARYAISDDQAHSLAWCEFKGEWWQEVWEVPLCLVSSALVGTFFTFINDDS